MEIGVSMCNKTILYPYPYYSPYNKNSFFLSFPNMFNTNSTKFQFNTKFSLKHTLDLHYMLVTGSHHCGIDSALSLKPIFLLFFIVFLTSDSNPKELVQTPNRKNHRISTFFKWKSSRAPYRAIMRLKPPL